MTDVDTQITDSLFMQLFDRTKGIDNFLPALFSFMRRRTDFFQDHGNGKNKMIEQFDKEHAKFKAEFDKKKKEEEKAEKIKQQKAEERKQQQKQDTNVIRNVADLDKVERKLEVIDDDEEATALKPTEDKITPTNTEVKEDKEKEKEEDLPEINKERAKHPDPVNNGGTTDKYTWSQTLKDFSLVIPLTDDTKSKQIKLEQTKHNFNLWIKGKEYLIDKKFGDEIKTAEFVWTIEVNEQTGEKTLNITCEKYNQQNWWEQMFKGDQKINLDKINAEQSSLSDLDGETRTTVEKMMYDQRAKASGMPTADEKMKKDKLADFMKQHPEMDFSKAKFC